MEFKTLNELDIMADKMCDMFDTTDEYEDTELGEALRAFQAAVQLEMARFLLRKYRWGHLVVSKEIDGTDVQPPEKGNWSMYADVRDSWRRKDED